jgi:hypothetical protein
VLDLGWWSTPRPARLTPGTETWYQLIKGLGGPQGRSGRLRKISPLPGFDPRTIQPHSTSLYWLSQLLDMYLNPDVQCFYVMQNYELTVTIKCMKFLQTLCTQEAQNQQVRQPACFKFPTTRRIWMKFGIEKILIKVFRHFHFNSHKWAPTANFFFLFPPLRWVLQAHFDAQHFENWNFHVLPGLHTSTCTTAL